MTVQFRLPDLGEGITEAEIVRWFVKPGDMIIQDQEIVAVQTDKAIVEIPAPVAGIVQEINGQEGQIVPVQTILLTIRTNDSNDSNDSNGANTAANTNNTSDAFTMPQIAINTINGHSNQHHNGTYSTSQPARGYPQRTLATPVARRMAREFGIDIATIKGTGHAGRVRTEDIQQAIATLKAHATQPIDEPIYVTAAPSPTTLAPLSRETHSEQIHREEERIPLRGLRRQIAENMLLSVHTIPQVTSQIELDATGLMTWRQEMQASAAEQGCKLSYLPLIIKALLQALRMHPMVNACLDSERQEIVLKHAYHIGIATATPDGLLVPVLRHADRLSILEIAQDLQRLTEAARERKLGRDELRGSTFTLSNYGSIGGFFTTPIINPGEAGILGLGKIVKRPWVVADQLEIRPILPLSFTADHRLIDGDNAMRFLNTLIDFLEHPAHLSIHLR